MENLMNIENNFNGVAFSNKFFNFLDVQSNETVKTYKNGIANFLQFMLDRNVTKPNRETVVDWKTTLKIQKSASTVNTYLVAVKSFFNFLDMYGLYPNVAKFVKGFNVSVTPKKNVLTEDQVKSIYSNIVDKRDKALFGLLITSGLRGIEVANAKIEDIREVNGEFCLFVKCKGHSENDEYVKIADNILEDIIDYIGNRTTGNIFVSKSNNNNGNGMTVRSIRRIIKAIFEENDIDDDTISLHSTRRTFACLSYNNGQSIYDIQQVLHHKNIATTTRYLKEADRKNNNSEKVVASLLA